MSFSPVFNYLTNSLITDSGLEFFAESKKAIVLAWLTNQNKKKNEACGFLFSGVDSIEQKPKSNAITTSYGIEDPGMLHFIYQKKSEINALKIYALNNDYSIIFIKAKEVQLIEGLKYM